MTTRPLEHQIVFRCLWGKRVSPKKVPNWSEISSNVLWYADDAQFYVSKRPLLHWLVLLSRFYHLKEVGSCFAFRWDCWTLPSLVVKVICLFFSFHTTRRNGFVVLRRQFSIDSGYIHTFRPPRLKSLFLWLSGKLWASGQRGRTKATTEKTLAWP